MSTNLVISDLAANIFTDTDCNEAEEDIKTSSAIIYAVEIDNESNTVSSYVKFWNTNTVTVGTTAPDMVIEAPAGEKLTVSFPQGVTFGTALTVACTTAGGTAGAVGPSNDVTLEVAYT